MRQKIFPRISTRGYYDLSNGKTLKNNSYYLYPLKYFRKLNNVSEIVIMIHGLQNNKAGALSKFIIAKRRLCYLKYNHPIIGYSYDSNTKGVHLKKTVFRAIRVGQKIAEKNGNNLVKFIIDFKKENPSVKIRLMGHSLGSQVILSTIWKLSMKRSTQNIIESVHFFGASIPSNAMNPSNFTRSRQNVVHKKIKNYFSPTDEVLNEANNAKYVYRPLGLYGASGKTILKFSQKKVKPKNHRFVSYASVLDTFP